MRHRRTTFMQIRRCVPMPERQRSCADRSYTPWIFPDTDAPLGEERSELFGGCVVIKGKGKRGVESSWKGGLYGLRKPELEDVEFTAVPYPYWNNRGEGEMIVWMRAL